MIAGAGMGSVCMNFMGWSLLIGLNSALDTLISQAGGYGNLELCGVYLNRGRFIMTCLFVPIIFFSTKMEGVLVYLGQNPVVAMYTQKYLLAILPGFYFMGLANCQIKFLINLKKPRVPMVSQLIASSLHPIWAYIFASKSQMNLGIEGIGYAMVVTNFVVLACNLVYTYFSADIREAVFWPDSRTFEGIKEYFQIGLPAAFMFILDIWAGCTVRFFSGYLSVEIQSAQIILNNIMVILYMFGAGLDSASCALIGQFLGAGKVSHARLYFKTFKLLTTTAIFIILILMSIFQRQVVSLYSDIPSIREEALKGIWLLLFNIYPDLFKGMLKGIIKAKGIQAKAVRVHLVTHWCIFPTLTYLFAFRYDYGIVGLWLAKIGLEVSIVIFYTLIINSVTWEESAFVAQQRIHQQEKIQKQHEEGTF